jgi:hypothetical protein
MVEQANRRTCFKVTGLAAGALALALSMPASAAESVSVTVNATIVGVCKFFTASPVLNIRNTGTSGSDIDPSLSTTATGSVPIEYRCSNGTSPNFSIASSVTLTGAGSMIASLSSTNTGQGQGMGEGKGQTLTLTGSIAQAEFQDKPVGAYSGPVVVSISP